MNDIRKKLKIVENKRVSSRTYLLRLKGDFGNIFKGDIAGRFVNIAIPGKYLRRPISIHRYLKEEEELLLLYNIAGEGTQILSELSQGEELDLLLDLGNGFSYLEEIHRPLLLGGGIGAAPLMQLALELVEKGIQPQVVLGFNAAEESWGMEKQLREIGIPSYVATIDGTAGTKGFVTDAIKENNLSFDYFYACGPIPMLKAVSTLTQDGQLSLECRMGCGFGACVCCSLETKTGNKRICKEGPVFFKKDLIWK